MAKQNPSKLNQLEELLPEGLVVDAAWLTRHGYSTSLRSQYVAAGWLEQPVRRVYRRKHGSKDWQPVVISLQVLLAYPLVVGGRTALELQGYAHYLSQGAASVHLYGPTPPPNWLYQLPLDHRFVYHNDRKLFRNEHIAQGFMAVFKNLQTGSDISSDPLSADRPQADLTIQSWGQLYWPLALSTPERALLELLDELPERETFHQVDKLVEGLSSLSPRRLQKLLLDCRNVKVKRLFFFFADRHQHAWLKGLDKTAIDLGKGKRMLVKGGKFDRSYQMTVPEDLDGVQ